MSLLMRNRLGMQRKTLLRQKKGLMSLLMKNRLGMLRKTLLRQKKGLMSLLSKSKSETKRLLIGKEWLKESLVSRDF